MVCPRAALALALVLAPACASTGREVPEPLTSAELIERGDAYFDGRRFDQALEKYKQAAFAARSEDDDARFAEAAAQVAHVYARLGQADEGRPWLDHAHQSADPEDAGAWARWLLVRGVYEELDGRRALALASYEEACDFAVARGALVRAVQAAHLASGVADDEQQVRWCRRALELARELGDERLQGALWGQLAWMLEERRIHGEALVAFQRAQRLAQAAGSEHDQLVADWSYGHGLRMAGRLEEARAVLQDVTDRAERRFRATRRPNDAEWLGQGLVELGELDVLEGQLARGLARLEEGRARLVAAGARELAPQRLAAVDRRIATLRAQLADGD
jgi:tetratricopeptide (TPR) repeat protein